MKTVYRIIRVADVEKWNANMGYKAMHIAGLYDKAPEFDLSEESMDKVIRSTLKNPETPSLINRIAFTGKQMKHIFKLLLKGTL